MSRFISSTTGVVVSVSDDKDERFDTQDWDPAPPAEKPAPKKAAATKTTADK